MLSNNSLTWPESKTKNKSKTKNYWHAKNVGFLDLYPKEVWLLLFKMFLYSLTRMIKVMNKQMFDNFVPIVILWSFRFNVWFLWFLKTNWISKLGTENLFLFFWSIWVICPLKKILTSILLQKFSKVSDSVKTFYFSLKSYASM